MNKTTKQSPERQVVSLVRNGKVTYPKTDEDYEVIRSLKMPMYFIDEDFFPLLLKASKLRGIHFNIINFADLETEMFQKVEAKWPFDITLSTSELVLKAPKNIKPERLDKLVDALRRWYRKHNISLDSFSKKSSKSLKMVLRKRLNT